MRLLAIHRILLKRAAVNDSIILKCFKVVNTQLKFFNFQVLVVVKKRIHFTDFNFRIQVPFSTKEDFGRDSLKLNIHFLQASSSYIIASTLIFIMYSL